jgi:hypothetical protein
MNIHLLKSWPKFFEPISTGIRTHELRRNDRNYQVGDHLELHEFDPTTGAYTGRVSRVLITSMTSVDEPCAVSAEALHPGFCILSVRRVATEY